MVTYPTYISLYIFYYEHILTYMLFVGSDMSYIMRYTYGNSYKRV